MCISYIFKRECRGKNREFCLFIILFIIGIDFFNIYRRIDRDFFNIYYRGIDRDFFNICRK